MNRLKEWQWLLIFIGPIGPLFLWIGIGAPTDMSPGVAIVFAIIFAVVVAGMFFFGIIGAMKSKADAIFLAQYGFDPVSEIDMQKVLERTQTLQEAYSLSPTEFEELIGQLFVKMGYHVVVTRSTGDEGVDLYLHKDELVELVQCKRYKGNVSVQTVREFFGVLVDKNANKGYIITTGHFTLPALQFADGKAIQLIDGPELAQLLTSVNSVNG